MVTIFRVDEVHRGDGPTVALLGRDANDRELRIEVPATLATGVRPGAALVLTWWTTLMPAPTHVWPASAAEPQAPAASASELAGGDPAAERIEAEFRALIGLR
jgi:hypothetical protein